MPTRSPRRSGRGELGNRMRPGSFRELQFQDALVQVSSEEIRRAFYDPKTKTMHMISGAGGEIKKPPTPSQRRMGKKGGSDKDENKTVIATR